MDDRYEPLATARILALAILGAIIALIVWEWASVGAPVLVGVLLAMLRPKVRRSIRNVFAATWRYLRPCRFSLISLVLGTLVFVVAGQGQEGLRSLGAEGVFSWHSFWFFFFVTVWGTTIWYWARVTYYADDPNSGLDGDDLTRFYRGYMPRLLGTGAFAAMFIGFVIQAIVVPSGSDGWLSGLPGFAVISFILGVLFCVLVTYRRKFLFVGDAADRLGKPLQRQTKLALSVWGSTAAGLFLYAAFFPVGMGNLFGADLVTLIGLTVWVPVFTAASLPFGRWDQHPKTSGEEDRDQLRWLTTCLFVLVLVLSLVLSQNAGNFLPLSASSWSNWENLLTVVLVGAMAGVYFLLVFKSPALVKAPIISIALIGALVFSFWNDNHIVRPSIDEDGDRFVPAAVRKTVSQDFIDWREQFPGSNGAGPNLVIVATAGGGLRAALWTGTVLGRLQDAYPAFKEHLFAVSGVSGGALGAMVFQSLLSYNARNRPGQIVNAAVGHCKGLRSIEGCAKEILGRDFLGQAFASMFFPELVQRLLPFSLQPVFADRAAALEMGWEDAWQDAMGVEDANNLMAGPFSELWQVNKRMPALFLNGTVVETARRIVASNLCIAEQRGKDRPVFREAYDFFGVVKHDVPVSTAANVAARFPYVAPAGTIRAADYVDGNGDRVAATANLCGVGSESAYSIRQQGDWRHFVDGGYFENFGVNTAIDVLNAIRLRPSGEESRKLKITVILISSDPDFSGPPPIGPFGENFNEVGNACVTKKVAESIEARQWAGELLSPPAAFLALRGAIGCSAAQLLSRWVAAHASGNGRFFHFRLTPTKQGREPALGWLLSGQSRDDIADQLCHNDANDNRKAFKGVIERLAGKGSFSEGMCDRPKDRAAVGPTG